MAIDSIEQKLKALEAFKDWSNYLLVTTVAALGWVSTKDAPHFSRRWIRLWCIWSFASSVFLAILTLALIPHIAELIDGSKSTTCTGMAGVLESGFSPSVFSSMWLSLLA